MCRKDCLLGRLAVMFSDSFSSQNLLLLNSAFLMLKNTLRTKSICLRHAQMTCGGNILCLVQLEFNPVIRDNKTSSLHVSNAKIRQPFTLVHLNRSFFPDPACRVKYDVNQEWFLSI